MHHPNWNTAFLGPFLVDVNARKIVPYDKASLDVSRLVNGDPDEYSYHLRNKRVRGRRTSRMVAEKGVYHGVSYGTLRSFDGLTTTKVEYEALTTFPFRGSASYDCTRLLSTDLEGNSLDHLNTYDFGTNYPSVYAPPVYLDMERKQLSDDGEHLIYSVWRGNCYTSVWDGINSCSYKSRLATVVSLNADGTVDVPYDYEFGLQLEAL